MINSWLKDNWVAITIPMVVLIGNYYVQGYRVTDNALKIKEQESRQEQLTTRVTAIEINVAKTYAILPHIATAVKEQTVATTKLTEQVIRLEEQSRR